MKFAINLKAALKVKSKTQSDLAEFLDVADNTISNWIVGRNLPSIATMESIAQWLGISLKWLLFGEDDVSDYFVEIPETNIELSAGNGRVCYEVDESSIKAAYRREWFEKEGLNPARCIRMRIKGDSNQPFLWENDVVLISLDEKEVIDGKMYAFAVDDGLFIKRLSKVPGDGLMVTSENPDYPPTSLSSQFEGRVQIIGRVRDKGGRGGL